MARGAAAVVVVLIALGSGTATAGAPRVDRPAKPVWCPLNGGSGTYDARRLLGRRLSTARRLAQSHRCTVRVVVKDGEALAVTKDFNRRRINVKIRDWIVVGLSDVG